MKVIPKYNTKLELTGVKIKYEGLTIEDPDDFDAPEWENCTIVIEPKEEGVEVSLLHNGEVKNSFILHPTELMCQSILERMLSRDVIELQEKLNSQVQCGE